MRTTIEAGTLVYNATTAEWKPAATTTKRIATLVQTTGRTQRVWYRECGADFYFIRVQS